jgi:hypothetical protein
MTNIRKVTTAGLKLSKAFKEFETAFPGEVFKDKHPTERLPRSLRRNQARMARSWKVLNTTNLKDPSTRFSHMAAMITEIKDWATKDRTNGG